MLRACACCTARSSVELSGGPPVCCTSACWDTDTLVFEASLIACGGLQPAAECASGSLSRAANHFVRAAGALAPPSAFVAASAGLRTTRYMPNANMQHTTVATVAAVMMVSVDGPEPVAAEAGEAEGLPVGVEESLRALGIGGSSRSAAARSTATWAREQMLPLATICATKCNNQYVRMQLCNMGRCASQRCPCAPRRLRTGTAVCNTHTVCAQ
jgi:hypothetical protein